MHRLFFYEKVLDESNGKPYPEFDFIKKMSLWVSKADLFPKQTGKSLLRVSIKTLYTARLFLD